MRKIPKKKQGSAFKTATGEKKNTEGSRGFGKAHRGRHRTSCCCFAAVLREQITQRPQNRNDGL